MRGKTENNALIEFRKAVQSIPGVDPGFLGEKEREAYERIVRDAITAEEFNALRAAAIGTFEEISEDAQKYPEYKSKFNFWQYLANRLMHNPSWFERLAEKE